MCVVLVAFGSYLNSELYPGTGGSVGQRGRRDRERRWNGQNGRRCSVREVLVRGSSFLLLLMLFSVAVFPLRCADVEGCGGVFVAETSVAGCTKEPGRARG